MGIESHCSNAGKRDPVAGQVGAAKPLHAEAAHALACRPTASVDIGAVDEIARGIVQPKGFTAVRHRTRIDLVGGKVRNGRVVSALQQEVSVGGQDAPQADMYVAAVK